eukprot:6101717-Ditylum_brightwellii.AAC.1
MKCLGSTLQSPNSKISRQEPSYESSFEGFCLQYSPKDFLSDKDSSVSTDGNSEEDSSISADVDHPIDKSTIFPSNSPDD